MSTAQLIGDRGGLPAETTSVALSRPEAARRLPLMIAGALLLVVLYAAFDHGAVALPVDARLQIVIAVIAAIGAAGWLAAGTIRLSAPRIAFGGVALLAAFALWSGVTLIWSVSPDQTWIELNRAVTYVIVVCLGIAIGASHARAVELSAKGFLAVALAVTAYALGQKLFPGLRVTGVFDLNQTGALPRLQEPLGYWNALALFIALGVPTALALAADATRSAPTRLASAAAVELMVLTIGLTYSRGGLLALAVALVVAVAAGGEALRTTLWLGLGIVAVVPPLAYGLASHSLTTAGVGLGSREGAGAILAAVLGGFVGGTDPGGPGPPRPRATPANAPGSSPAGMAFGAHGGGGTRGGRRAGDGAFLSGPERHGQSRLEELHLHPDGQQRQPQPTAIGRFGEPVGVVEGGRARVWRPANRRLGSRLFRCRPPALPPRHAAGAAAPQCPAPIPGRDGRGGDAAGSHGIRAPADRRPQGGPSAHAGRARAATGRRVVGRRCGISGARALRLGLEHPRGNAAGADVPRPAGGYRWGGAGSAGASSGFRPLWLGALCLWLCAFALSAALPSIAASKANSALVAAASGSPSALRSAQASSALAARLDPLSDAGLRAEAAVALHRGQLVRARNYLQEGVARNPTDGFAWEELAQVDGVLRDIQGAQFAFQRVVALDPRGQAARASRVRK
jgi:hypothetical protein